MRLAITGWVRVEGTTEGHVGKAPCSSQTTVHGHTHRFQAMIPHTPEAFIAWMETRNKCIELKRHKKRFFGAISHFHGGPAAAGVPPHLVRPHPACPQLCRAQSSAWTGLVKALGRFPRAERFPLPLVAFGWDPVLLAWLTHGKQSRPNLLAAFNCGGPAERCPRV